MPQKKASKPAPKAAIPTPEFVASLREKKVLTAAEVAIYTGFSRRTIERWNSSGVLNPIKLSVSKYVYRRESVDALLDEREVVAS
jgi:hypothetical protein